MEEEFLTQKEIETLQEFIQGTPAWLEQMKILSRQAEHKACFHCGMRYESIEILLSAIKKLYVNKRI